MSCMTGSKITETFGGTCQRQVIVVRVERLLALGDIAAIGIAEHLIGKDGGDTCGFGKTIDVAQHDMLAFNEVGIARREP